MTADVVLVGVPGAGKTTVGALLAVRMGVPFTDVDAVIEDQFGQTIGEMFADRGEPWFRATEEAITAQLLAEPGVLSLGGGAVLSPVTRAALAGHRVVWLRVGATAAAKRVGLTSARPLLLGNVRGRLVQLLNERTPLYASVATQTVDTDVLAPAAVVDQLLRPAADDD